MANIDKKPFDKNGKKHGEWVIHWYSGEIWYRCNYFHGVLHGLDETFLPNGRLGHRGYLNMGRRVGYWVIGIKNGNKDWCYKKSYYLCLI